MSSVIWEQQADDIIVYLTIFQIPNFQKSLGFVFFGKKHLYIVIERGRKKKKKGQCGCKFYTAINMHRNTIKKS